MASEITVCVAGCGGLGRREAQIVAGMEGVRLLGVCDVNQDSAESLAAELGGGVRAFGGHEEMLTATAPDAVLVVTPTFTHRQVTVDALQAGAHVFCEKPMAISLAECDAMLAAAEREHRTLAIGYVRRFMPNYREMKRRVEAGDLGAVRLVQSVRMGGRPPIGVGSWRLEASKVGGLHSAYVHELDQMLWLGGPVSAVRAVANYGTFADTDVEDSIWMALEFVNGAVGALGASQVYPVGWYELGVGGTLGAMSIRRGTTELTLRAHGGEAETVTLESNDPFAEELGAFFDSLRGAGEPPASGVDGRETLAVVEAAFRAARTGETVRLPPEA